MASRLLTTPLLVLIFPAILVAADSADADPEYVRVTTERARKIVATLGIDDEARSTRVTEIIARQFRDLSVIHASRDEKIAAARKQSDDPGSQEAAISSIQRDSEVEQNRHHYAFIARLSAELTPAQVDQVKDGLTYNVVNITFRRYQEMLPSLTDEQKRTIHTMLLEAREHALDAGSSEAKHGTFKKYKGGSPITSPGKESISRPRSARSTNVTRQPRRTRPPKRRPAEPLNVLAPR